VATVHSAYIVFRLRASGIPFRLCSNASTQTRGDFVNKLRRHGFELDESEVICPAPILAAILKQQQMRPYLLVHPGMTTSDFPQHPRQFWMPVLNKGALP